MTRKQYTSTLLYIAQCDSVATLKQLSERLVPSGTDEYTLSAMKGMAVRIGPLPPRVWPDDLLCQINRRIEELAPTPPPPLPPSRSRQTARRLLISQHIRDAFNRANQGRNS